MNGLQKARNLKIDYEDHIAIIQFNQENSKVNTLSQDLMNEFIPLVDQLKMNDDIKGIVLISAKPGSFIAGADIKMIESVKTREEIYEMSRRGQEIMNQIERSTKPIVAAIAGQCLGGGFEVALACHYRIAVNDKRTGFGLPEVKLGLLPGAGGTQRILKNLLLTEALDLLLTGKEIKAKKAKAMGLIDLLVEPIRSDVDNMEQETIEYLHRIAVKKINELIVQNSSKPPNYGLIHNVKSMLMQNSYVQNYILSQARIKVMSQTQGLYPAPLKILDVVIQTLKHGPDVGLNAEAEGFADLWMTNESRALISLFHGRTECKKNKYGEPSRDIKAIAIVGSNMIGAGIAHVSIDKDFQVILCDTTTIQLYQGRLQIINSYKNYIKRGRITNERYNRILTNLRCQTTFENLEKCDIVIEACIEDLYLKQNILKELEQHMPEHCIYASNTFLLSIEQIAKNSRRPHQVVGMHYFAPVDKVELLEIVRTEQTSDRTMCEAINVGLKQGKIIIVINDHPGFYTTRLLLFSCIEVFKLLKEGISPKDIDVATKQFGFHIGLATLLDEFGFDKIAVALCHLQEAFGEQRINSSLIELIRSLIRNNLLGKKSQQGLFIYHTNGSKTDNPRLLELLKNSFMENNNGVTKEDIQWRISLQFINEAARCLERNVICSPTDGDVGAVFGLGFPPMKGGPFRFTDTYGTSRIVDLMNSYQMKYGDRFAPTQILVDMASQNKKFYA